MNVIEIEPLPSDITSDEWYDDSTRIKEENKREMKHEIHIDGLVRIYGGVEEYMKEMRPIYTDLINSRF